MNLCTLKPKEFTNVRKWIVHNLDNDPVRMYRRIYDSLYNHADSSTIPHAVLILSKYQYQSRFCRRPRNKSVGMSNGNYGGCEMEIDNVQVVKPFASNYVGTITRGCY